MSDIRGGLQISSASHHQPLSPLLPRAASPPLVLMPRPKWVPSTRWSKTLRAPALPPGFVFLPRLAFVWNTEVFCKIRKGDLRIPGDLLQMEMDSLPKELSLLNLDFRCLNLKNTCASQLSLPRGGCWSQN